MASTVLYIDDVLELPPRTSDVLEPVGFELVHLRDPDEAARRLRQEPPAIVLIEVLLEACDGFELIEQFVSAPEAARVPIVVVTRGERTPELYGRALELGVRDFLCKPVLEAQVLAAVLEFAQQPPTAAKHPRAAGPPEAAQAAESGALAARPVPELLARLHRIGASGTLHLKQSMATRAVQFRNGSPVVVSAPKPRETFEEYVLRTGWIKQEQFEIAIEHQLGGVCDPRTALVAMEALSASQAEQAAQEQAREALLDLFRWDAGTYEFKPHERIAAAESLALDWDPIAALIEGVRSACPERVVRAALDARSTSCAFAGPDLDSALELAGAPPEQRAKLAALAGERTLAEEIAAAKLDPRLLYGLVLLGAVELEMPLLELIDALNIEPAPAVAAPVAQAARRPRRPPATSRAGSRRCGSESRARTTSISSASRPKRAMPTSSARTASLIGRFPRSLRAWTTSPDAFAPASIGPTAASRPRSCGPPSPACERRAPDGARQRRTRRARAPSKRNDTSGRARSVSRRATRWARSRRWAWPCISIRTRATTWRTSATPSTGRSPTAT